MSYEPNNPESSKMRPPPSVDDDLAKTASPETSRASDLGRKASQKAEQVRMAAAGGLDSAAHAMHQGADSVSAAAHSTADTLESGAKYVRSNDLRQMSKDLLSVVKNNPGVSLIGAIALGFLVGRAFSRE